MKRLLLLFPLYILFLSCLPCSPTDECCQEEIQATAFTKQSDNKQNSAKDQKPGLPCSPFFPCGACHGIVIPDHSIRVTALAPPVTKQLSGYTPGPLPVFTYSIWQPPRFA